MIKKTFLFLFIFVYSSFFMIAQDDESWHCLTDEIYREILQTNPDALKERAKLQNFVENYVQNIQKSHETYIVPVVFHVVHYYGIENITYEQIESAIDFMNKDFNLLRADTSGIVETFRPIAADCNIEFRLARKDPYGNCTMGVTRTVSETTFAGGEQAKEAAPTWPPENYLNIWVVNALPHGAAGWSYYPGTAPYGSDGVILLHDYVGVTGTSSMSHGSTLTHEVGHFLNLAHPWGSTNEPGILTNCDVDDDIEDTPNTIGHTTCALSAVTCGSLDNVQNFMEYSYCTKMFTNGQSQMMRAVLNSSVASRDNLISEANLIATGTNNDYIPEICVPVADFTGNKKLGCEGFSVEYNNLTHGTDQVDAFSWSFEGGIPEISYDENPVVVYDVKGEYNVELTVANNVNTNIKNANNYIRVYNKQDAYTLPYTVSFETDDFPKITGNDDNDFYIESRGQEHWKQTPYGAEGKAMRIINKRNEIGTKNRIYLPNLRITDTDNQIYVSFKAAYGKYGTADGDRLKIYVSTSCGDSLRIVDIISGTRLVSSYTSYNNTYVPVPDDWKTHSFVIKPYVLNGENLRLIVEVEAGEGNALYIDEFNFSYTNSIDNIQNSSLISAFPNPTSGSLFLENQLSGTDYTIQIFDTMGKLLFETITSNEIYDASSIIDNKPSGLYLVKIKTNQGNKVIKINKTK
ncbi:MAG: M43 family zinc metalloprotease [Bacteroidales bacterium]|nr:M43 family zinc metalloprotease [Bacteroidales bacterium]MDY0141172.1 M43 family zinc metalloprotease [Bacteroidales bacterium]